MAVPHRDTKSPKDLSKGSAEGSPVNSPKAIVFDIGRVIVRVNLQRIAPIAAALKSAGQGGANVQPAPEQIWRAIQSLPRWNDWQEGRLTAEQWHTEITGHLGIRVGFAEFCAGWNTALDPETILSDDLFAELGAHYRLGLLSNTDPLHVEHMEKHFSFMRHFPVRIYSCRVGASKPNPAIYEEALRGLSVAAAEALYIDDIPEFAAAARQLGMDAIQFENAAQLKRELELRGIPRQRT